MLKMYYRSVTRVLQGCDIGTSFFYGGIIWVLQACYNSGTKVSQVHRCVIGVLSYCIFFVCGLVGRLHGPSKDTRCIPPPSKKKPMPFNFQ